MTVFAVAFVVLGLGFANGANDNFKGVATLFGSGTARYRTALAWATGTTLAGSLLALVLAAGLADTFRGKGLVPDAVAGDRRFLLAVGAGAALTVLLATRLGMPVSTTHALTGGLLGAGVLASDGDVRLAALRDSFVVPLLVSPIVALVLAGACYPALRGLRRAVGVTEEIAIRTDGTAPAGAERRTRYAGRVAGVAVGPALDALHFLSAGAVCFARALNDTPKLVAILLAAKAVDPAVGVAAVAAAMAVGGAAGARRVAETMSLRITRLSPGQGLVANLVTATMVLGASRLGLPVSTTHVSVGALFGIGTVTGAARVRTVLTILVAWVTTLPLGAAASAAVYLLIGYPRA